MKQRLTKQNLIRAGAALVFLLLFGVAIFFANRGFDGYEITPTTGVEYETARVLCIDENTAVADEAIEGRYRGLMEMDVELLTGRYKGEIARVTNYLSAMYNVWLEEGDTLSVRVDTVGENAFQVSVYNYDRIPAVIGVLVLFAVALVVIGGKQGFRALVGLVFTFVSVVYLLLPLTLKGWNAVALTVVLVGVTSTVCFYLLGGWKPKIIGAALGCLCGVACAAVLGAVASELLHISAYQMDEAEALLLVRNDSGLRLNGLLLSGILIAAEGAVMDTAMSVASAMEELKSKRPDIGRGELFRSGMKIGRDATGTMANTLVLAFAGSSLNMMLLIYSYDVSVIQLMNTDFVAVEVVRAVAGSMGIILTVPCVAGVTAWLLGKGEKIRQIQSEQKKKKRK